jgi:hypothetical protein
MLCPLLNSKSDLSVRNGVMLYKPHDGLRVPRVEVRCPLPCPEATSFAIQVSSPCYWCPLVRNRQIHEDLSVPLFADHLTASFDSKLADVGNPLLRQLGRYLRRPRVDPLVRRESQGRQGPAGQSRPSPAMAKSGKRIAFGAYQPSAFRIP